MEGSSSLPCHGSKGAGVATEELIEALGLAWRIPAETLAGTVGLLRLQPIVQTRLMVSSQPNPGRRIFPMGCAPKPVLDYLAGAKGANWSMRSQTLGVETAENFTRA